MQLKESVALAKRHVGELFADEKIANLGLEEVEFDDRSGEWSITVGFSRPWDQNPLLRAVGDRSFQRRDYKVVRISDADGRVISVKNREPAM